MISVHVALLFYEGVRAWASRCLSVCVITRSMTALLAQSRDAGLFVDLCWRFATLGYSGAARGRNGGNKYRPSLCKCWM